MGKITNFGRIVVGSLPTFDASFSVDGLAADPTTLTFSYRIDDGDIITLEYGVDSEIVKTDTGEYSIELPVTEPGRWYGRWEAVGAVDGASELMFDAWTNFGEYYVYESY